MIWWKRVMNKWVVLLGFKLLLLQEFIDLPKKLIFFYVFNYSLDRRLDWFSKNHFNVSLKFSMPRFSHMQKLITETWVWPLFVLVHGPRETRFGIFWLGNVNQ